VSWLAPSSTGGSPITGYTVTSSPGGKTATTTGAVTAIVTGLTNGTAYTFTVTARNAIGTGLASSASAAVTPAGPPGAPTNIAATAGNGQATVSWTAPASNGSTITGYTVTSSPGGKTATTTGAITATVTGLTNGTAYTFTVTATNAKGTGPASAASAAITPTGPPSAPTAVTATPGNTQAVVSWTAPASNGGSAITGYTVTSAPGAKTATTTGATTATVTGLTNGTAYTFTVTAKNAKGTSPASAASTAVTPAAPPGAPTAVSATAGNAQAAVSWIAPSSTGGSPITGYTVTSNPGGLTATTTGALTATVTGLTNGTAYTFTVVARNTASSGPASTASNAVTPTGPPGAPTSVAATAGNAQATVSWTAPASNGGSPITGYTVTSSPGGITASTTGATTATVSGLTNGTTYTFTVTATNAKGTGAASLPSAVVTPTGLPGAPTSVTATAADGQATVSWTAPASNGGSPITGYTVISGPGGLMASTTGAVSVAVTGLTDGIAYTFTVTATNLNGTGPRSAVSNTVTPLGAPTAPTNVVASAGDTQSVVAWTAPTSTGGSSITGYTVTATPGGATVTTTGATSVTVTGLTNGTAYAFTVVANNAVGASASSVPSTPVTPIGPPGAPTAVIGSGGDGQATVSWMPPASDGGSSITGYTVTSSPGGKTAATTGATTATVIGLSNGIAYTFTVTATNAAGIGAPSAPSAPVTPIPPGPTSITLTVDHATFPLGGSSTLTATTDIDVAPSGQTITIIDQTSNTPIASCAAGTTCTATVTFITGPARTYVAEVGSLVSDAVSVSRLPWTVSLAQDKTVFEAGDRVTLTATANQRVRNTGFNYYIFIMDNTTGQLVTFCDTDPCSGSSAFYTGGPHTYTAYVAPLLCCASGNYYPDSTATQATSAEAVSASRRLWTVSLAIDKTVFEAGDRVTLTATANQNVTNTGLNYYIFIVDNTSGETVAYCYSAAPCSGTSVFYSGGPHTYTAYVAPPLCCVYGSYYPDIAAGAQATSPQHPTASRLPWTVSLTQDKTVFAAGDHVALTATVNQNIGNTGGTYSLIIMDNISGYPVTVCTDGRTCTGNASFFTGGAHNYTAYVAPYSWSAGGYRPGNDVQATSPEVVTASRQPWMLSLVAIPQNNTISVGDTITFVAGANQDVGLTEGSYNISLRDITTGALMGTCFTGKACVLNIQTSYDTLAPYVAYVGADGWSGDGPPDMQANSDGYSAITTHPAWNLTLAADPSQVIEGDTVTLTATANQDLATTSGADWSYIFDQTTNTLLTTCASGSGCVTTITYTGGQPHSYLAFVSASQPGISSADQLTETLAVSNVATISTTDAYATPGSNFNPTVTLDINNWHYNGDDATGQSGIVDYDLSANVTGTGDGGPCAASGCRVVIEGGMPDENNIIHKTAPLVTDPYGIWGSEPPFATTKTASNASVPDQLYIRAAVYAPGDTLVADSAWHVASSLPLQDPQLIAEAGPLLAGAYAALPALQSLAGGELSSACLAMFPTGTRVNGSTVNDEQLSCMTLIGRLALATGARILAELIINFSLPTIKTVLGITIGLVLKALTPPSPDPDEDPAWLQRIERFRTRGVAVWGTNDEATQKQYAKTVLRQCIEQAQERGQQDQCDTIPIFAPGIDMPEIAAHDSDAIAQNPQLDLLNYTTTPPVSSGWYSTWRGTPNECFGKPAPYDTNKLSCDEYPFRSTVQAGPPTASLRPVSIGNHTTQSSWLKAFYTCPNVKAGATFMVVPMVVDAAQPVGPPTTAWCGL
jgi:hypothetical protein